MSKLFSQTLREAPTNTDVVSHQFLLRAGYIRPLAAGIFSLLPLARRSISKIEAIMRQIHKPATEVEALQPITKIATPDITTIAALATMLNVHPAKTAKAVFMVASCVEDEVEIQKFVFAVVRGDMELNETKLANVVKSRNLRPALDNEIRAIGAVPGYGSPIRVHDALIVVDDAVAVSANLVAGANEEGYHLLNVNHGRDYQAHIVADIAVAQEGDACPSCGYGLRSTRGIEVGNIFQLGTRYSETMHCTFHDEKGIEQPVIMGSYGIGVGRLLACIAEEHRDDRGLCWPISVAPCQVHLVALKGDANTEATAEQLYADFQTAGIEALFDDRSERPGVKFMDADLIGIPLRITVGDRALKRGGVELKHRKGKDTTLVHLADVVSKVRLEIESLRQQIAAQQLEQPYV